MHLTIKERVELVLMSGADGATNRSVAKKFNRIYPDREPIPHTTIGRLILKFRETGIVLDKFFCFGTKFVLYALVRYLWPTLYSLNRHYIPFSFDGRHSH